MEVEVHPAATDMIPPNPRCPVSRQPIPVSLRKAQPGPLHRLQTGLEAARHRLRESQHCTVNQHCIECICAICMNPAASAAAVRIPCFFFQPEIGLTTGTQADPLTSDTIYDVLWGVDENRCTVGARRPDSEEWDHPDADVLLDLQNPAPDAASMEDVAQGPLFYRIAVHMLQRPTYRLWTDLLNSYNSNVNAPESYSEQKLEQIDRCSSVTVFPLCVVVWTPYLPPPPLAQARLPGEELCRTSEH